MSNFSIRTATDPDLGSREGIDQHKLATETFQRILWDLCEATGVFDNDHERAPELYARAAFDTALELGVELVQEDIAGGIEFTFNFVPTILITEVDQHTDRNRSALEAYDPAAEFADAINDESEWDLDAFDEEPPNLTALNQGGGIWALCLDGKVVLDDESYAVVHGIIENADVDELREIRASLTTGANNA